MEYLNTMFRIHSIIFLVIVANVIVSCSGNSINESSCKIPDSYSQYKEVKEFYVNGSRKASGEVNVNGGKEGFWKFFDLNGNVTSSYYMRNNSVCLPPNLFDRKDLISYRVLDGSGDSLKRGVPSIIRFTSDYLSSFNLKTLVIGADVGECQDYHSTWTYEVSPKSDATQIIMSVRLGSGDSLIVFNHFFPTY